MCARIAWMNRTSAKRLDTTSEPGAWSAISDASNCKVVCVANYDPRLF
jgi:hypothetical protein